MVTAILFRKNYPVWIKLFIDFFIGIDDLSH